MEKEHKNAKNNHVEETKFRKKHIHHDPQSESSRAVFDEPKAK